MTRMRAETTQTATAQGACTCAWAGCDAPGVYKAPKDRSLSHYVMFCLDHVRAYNAKWDFHIHMSPDDIEAEIRRMVTWDRPTWPIGQPGPAKARAWTPHGLHDPLDLGDGTAFDIKRRKQTQAQSWAEAQGFKAEERKALRVLDIDGPFTLAELKRRYKELVKQHHPDTNGGSREAEARMKAINAAHQTLLAAMKRVST